MADSLLSPAQRSWHEAAARYVSSLQRSPVSVTVGSELLVESLAALGVEFAAVPKADLVVIAVSTASDTLDVTTALREAVASDREILLLGSPNAVAVWAARAAEAGAYRVPSPADAEVCGALLRPGDISLPELVGRYEPLLAEIGALQAELTHLRHQQLTGRDFAIGAEASVSRMRIELAEAEARIADLEELVTQVYASRTWRIGNRIVRPVYKVKQAVNR